MVECLLFLTSFILQLRAVEETISTGWLGGVPLLQRISIDIGFSGFDPRPSLPLPMIPRIGVNREAAFAALKALSLAGLDLHIAPDPSVIRRMLIACAMPMDDYKPHEVGFGFVSRSSTIGYLSHFTGLDLAELFLEESGMEDSLRNTLLGCKLTHDNELGALYDIALRSSLVYSIDYSTGEIYASMRAPRMDSGETGFRREPTNYSWPPAMQ